MSLIRLQQKLLIAGALFFLVTSDLQAQKPGEKWSYQEASKAMTDGYWKHWNNDVQKKIDADIDKYRKADAALKVGAVAEGTDVTIEQISHEFVFGANIFNYNQLGTTERNSRYKHLFGSLFNSATIPFYWKKFEMQPGRPRFKEEYWDTEAYWNNVAEPKKQPHWRRPAPDPIVAFCEEVGIRRHGHTMTWGNRTWHHPEWLLEDVASEQEKNTIKSWMSETASEKKGIRGDKYTDAYKKLSAEEVGNRIPQFAADLKRLTEDRIAQIARYYGDRLQSWDIVNESATDFANGVMVPGDAICKSHYGIMPGDYTHESFQVAKKVFPSNVLLNINDYKIDESYVRQAKDLISRNNRIDIMGYQMHLFNPQQCTDISLGKEIQTPQHVRKTMEVMGQAGLPVHLSEITITAPDDNAKGRAIQSVIAYNLYRMWFSMENMMGITWWNIVDDCGAPGEPTTSGIFTRNMEPKPAFYALDQLINHEWKTNLTAKPAAGGQVAFRGFKGKYRVTWKDKNGDYQERIFDLSKNGDGF
ncbi:MAG: 1,4-beta-xylanase [Cytophagaceae bacterium SCN 52-12]|nr:MAG: 1,4-beta-xylanase [Cytophagaceae bacterium SCN 52-12]